MRTEVRSGSQERARTLVDGVAARSQPIRKGERDRPEIAGPFDLGVWRKACAELREIEE